SRLRKSPAEPPRLSVPGEEDERPVASGRKKSPAKPRRSLLEDEPADEYVVDERRSLPKITPATKASKISIIEVQDETPEPLEEADDVPVLTQSAASKTRVIRPAAN